MEKNEERKLSVCIKQIEMHRKKHKQIQTGCDRRKYTCRDAKKTISNQKSWKTDNKMEK